MYQHVQKKRDKSLSLLSLPHKTHITQHTLLIVSLLGWKLPLLTAGMCDTSGATLADPKREQRGINRGCNVW